MNHNPDTGIAFGYIRADAIDPDLWRQLCDSHGTDVNYASALADFLANEKKLHEALQEGDHDDEDFDEIEATQAFADEYQCDEPIYEGEHEGVKYRTSWLGGAPHLWVFQSPVITKCRPCSICVPGAGNLDQTGDYEAYGLPASWLTEDFLRDQCDESGFEFTHGGTPHFWREVGKDSNNGGPFAFEESCLIDCYEKNLQRKIEETNNGTAKDE